MSRATFRPAWPAFIATLGQHVHAMRTLLGLSQQELAVAAGTSQGCVSRLESGHCLAVPLLSVLKLLVVLADALPQVEDAVAPTTRALLACVKALGSPHELPVDPGLATLLRAYRALPAGRRATFRQLVLPLAAVLADARLQAEPAPDAPEPDVPPAVFEVQ